MSQKMKTSELIPHKDNDFFFDDIAGEAWQEFIDSIKTSGVIEPIVVTQNKVIISGHQRVRACKTLGIDEIEAEVRIIDSEDEILKQLIETNIRQRGIGNTNPVKFGRCIKELERIYGIKNGGDRKSEENNLPLKSQEDLARELGITDVTLRNYKLLAEMIPEIQTLVETGIVTPTTARAIVKKLPEFQQRELAKQFAEKGEKVTGKEASEEIEKIKSELEDAQEENKTLREANKDLEEERDYLQFQIQEMEEAEPKTIIPDDYEELKKKAKKASAFESDYKKEQSKVLEKQNEILRLQDEIEELKRGSGEGVDSANISENVFYFCAICNNFISNVGGLVWLTERIADMPEREKDLFLKAARSFNDWSQVFKDNLERSLENGQTRTDTGVPLLTD